MTTCCTSVVTETQPSSIVRYERERVAFSPSAVQHSLIREVDRAFCRELSQASLELTRGACFAFFSDKRDTWPFAMSLSRHSKLKQGACLLQRPPGASGIQRARGRRCSAARRALCQRGRRGACRQGAGPAETVTHPEQTPSGPTPMQLMSALVH